MKRSSPYSPSSCSSSSPSSSSSTSSSFASSSPPHNSSSSCVGSESEPLNHPNHGSQPEKPKSKRARKASTSKSNKSQQEKCLNVAGSPTSSSRRSSIYRGVTRHRWTGRYEAHLWDKSSWNNIQNKKGRQVYLGAYDNEEAAARTYDLAALKYWGPETILNFPIDSYTKEIDEMQKVTKEEYLASLRRQSSGFSRGVSKYRGVARHHHNGRWEARIGRVFGNKYLYLGTYNTQEEAAAAYDMAAIEYRGPTAVTNFDISNYIDRLKKKGVALDNSSSSVFGGSSSPPNCSARMDESEPAEVGRPLTPLPLPLPPSGLASRSCERKEEPRDLALVPDQCGQFAQCVDTGSMSLMESIDEEVDLDWSFCLDSGLASLPMPDLHMEHGCEFPDLFSNVGFEDDIGMIFDVCTYKVEAEVEASASEGNSDNSGCGAEEMGKAGGLFVSSTSNSPACSTTSTVTCSYEL